MPVRNNAFFSFAGTDVSTDVMSLNVDEPMASNDATTMSAITRYSEPALTNWSITGVVQGEANGRGTSEVAFQDIFRTSAKTAAIIYRNDAGAQSVDNAEWTGTAVLSQWAFNGATGAKLSWSFTIMPGSTLTRATS